MQIREICLVDPSWCETMQRRLELSTKSNTWLCSGASENVKAKGKTG
jgi:hypothetical protein